MHIPWTPNALTQVHVSLDDGARHLMMHVLMMQSDDACFDDAVLS
jgi:hypothetical protein